MYIRLYRNCIVNNKYSEVFRNKTLFSDYLDTLYKYPLNEDLHIDLTYIQLNDVLSFEPYEFGQPSKNPNEWLQYNYIRFYPDDADASGLLYQDEIYAFIDSIEYVNGLVVINYSCDYWHTFLGKWSLRDSLVTRTRKLIDNHPYELPIEYISNSGVYFKQLNIESQNEDKFEIDYFNNEVCLIMELQLYTLSQGGEEVFRKNKTFVIGKEVTGIAQGIYNIPIWQIDLIIDKITSLQNQPNLALSGFYSGQPTPFYFDIVNIYVVPFYFMKNTMQFDTMAYSGILTFNENNKYPVREVDSSVTETNSLIDLFSFNIKPNKQLKSFGFFTSQIPYMFNGLEKQYKVSLFWNNYMFRLFLIDENNAIDITDVFTSGVNFTELSPDTLISQKINRKMETMQGISGIINSSFNLLGGVANIGVGVGRIGIGNELSKSSVSTTYGHGLSSQTTINPTLANRGIMSKSLGAGNIISGAGDIANGVTGIIENSMKIKFANMERYKNSNFVNNEVEYLSNCKYGVLLKFISSPINEQEFNGYINEIGYEVDYFTNNLDLGLNTTGWDFNTIKFDFVRLVGLSSSINSIIENILMSGTKIWYNSTGVENA